MNQNIIYEYEPFWGSWYIDSMIGEGSYGKVYQIYREEFGIKHYSAMKMISIPKSDQDIKQKYYEGMSESEVKGYFREIVEDIYSEICVMSQLKGKTNVVSYEDHDIIQRKDGIGCDILIRMELLSSVNEYEMEHKLSLKEVVNMGIDICEGLELCRKNQIIHRDIKPDNIFRTADGDFKLGDFGIARKLNQTELGMSVKGTYEYMAPEVYHGLDYDERVDIYSLGVVLYYFLNNKRLPFTPSTDRAVSYGDRQEAVKKRFNGLDLPYPVNVSKQLGDIILKACAYREDERYQTAAEFRDALRNVPAFQSDEKLNEGMEGMIDLDGTVMLSSLDEDFEEEVVETISPEEEKEGEYILLIAGGAALFVCCILAIFFIHF